MTLLSPGDPFPSEYPKGAVLLVDKPLAWTSFDVVNKVRYLLSRRLGIKRIKIGHAGTLDPLATGLLVLCTGEYTKRIESLQALEKEYTGTITFGATTASYDLEKPVDAVFPAGHLTDDLLQKVVFEQFTGEISQIPPVFSAIKVDGKRVYKNARTGQITAIEPRSVRIDTFELGPLRPVEPGVTVSQIISKKGAPIHLHPDYAEGRQCDFRVVCGKGTYIRSLAHDLGQALDSGAYLSRLRRTATGGFRVESAWTIEALEAWLR